MDAPTPPAKNASESSRVFESYQAHVLDALASGVLALDTHGCIVAANEAACAHLGLESCVLVPGTPMANVRNLSTMAPYFEQVLSTQEAIERQEMVIDIGEDEKKEIGLSAGPLMIEGVIRGVVFLFTDMTVRRR